MIEARYRAFLEALGIVRMVAGGSYDNLNMMAAWCAVNASKGLR